MPKRITVIPGAGWLLDERAARDRIERLRRLYVTQDNPVFAWEAYQLARSARLDMPSWVLEYFDLAAENIAWARCREHLRIAQRQPVKDGEIAARIVKALGFSPGGVEITLSRDKWPDKSDMFPLNQSCGRFNPLTADDRKLFLSESVSFCMQRGETRAQAKRTVARVNRVSTKTVERALEDYPLSQDTN